MAAFIQLTDKASGRVVYVNPENIYAFTPNVNGVETDILITLGGTLVTKTVSEAPTEVIRRVSSTMGVITP